MMKKYAMSTFPAYEVGIVIEGTIQEYAMNFLHIFNNVKTQEGMIRLTNDYCNGVQVVCTEEMLEPTKKYLSQFGEIQNVAKVLCMSLEEDPDYDWKTYEDLVIVPYVD